MSNDDNEPAEVTKSPRAEMGRSRKRTHEQCIARAEALTAMANDYGMAVSVSLEGISGTVEDIADAPIDSDVTLFYGPKGSAATLTERYTLVAGNRGGSRVGGVDSELAQLVKELGKGNVASMRTAQEISEASAKLSMLVIQSLSDATKAMADMTVKSTKAMRKQYKAKREVEAIKTAQEGSLPAIAREVGILIGPEAIKSYIDRGIDIAARHIGTDTSRPKEVAKPTAKVPAKAPKRRRGA